MRNAFLLLERRECTDESGKIASFGGLSDVGDIWNILAQDSPAPIGQRRTLLQRTKLARVDTLGNYVYRLRPHPVKMNHVLLAEFADGGNARCAFCAQSVDRPGLVEFPPTKACG